MRKSTFYIMLSMILMAITSWEANAQRGYTEFDNEDSLKIMYRWQRASLFDKESDAVLNIRVTNNNESTVNWTYSVGFYRQGVLVLESEPDMLCLKPGQSRRGALAGLRFSAEGVKIADVEEDGFSWEFGVFDVVEVENCE
jgi:hypothetical protein